MARFADALDRKREEIRRPPPPPIGHYIAQVAKMPGAPELSKDGKYEFLRIDCRLLSPTDDVDEDMLAEAGNIQGTPIRVDFIFNTEEEEQAKFESTLNRLKQFVEHCGVDTTEGALKEWLSQIVNAQFLLQVTHEIDKQNPENVYTRAGRTAAIE